jgi:poly(3-hydroxybutyrate) depolymerase
MKHRFICLFAVLLGCLISPAACRAQIQLPENVHALKLTVGDVARSGFVYAPATAKEKPTPVVFVFHGHGGNALQAGRSFAMHKHWPEAISVYLQGLNTPGRLTDPEGKKPGWQHGAGAEGDRDLKLFDAVLAHLKESYKVDASASSRPGTRMAAGSPICCGRRGRMSSARWLRRRRPRPAWRPPRPSSRNQPCISPERMTRW